MKIEKNINGTVAGFLRMAFMGRQNLFGFLLAFCLGSAMVYALNPLEIAHTFSSGEVISAQEMNNNFLAIKAKVDELAAAVEAVPVGSIIPFAGSTPPAGWLLCDGSEVNRTTYAALYAVIQSKWGAGDFNTTFNLPDLRGRFLRGVDNGSGNDPDAASRFQLVNGNGGNTGNDVGTYQNDAFQGHWHNLYKAYRVASSGGGGTSYLGEVMWDGPSFTGNANSTHTLIKAAINDGINGIPRISAETRSKNANVNYIIKY